MAACFGKLCATESCMKLADRKTEERSGGRYNETVLVVLCRGDFSSSSDGTPNSGRTLSSESHGRRES